MMTERILTYPGFLYELGGTHYFLGKWICRECTETEASDCVTMYHMCRAGQEEPDTNLYFQKIRAFSDFALEIPHNPEKIKKNMTALIDSLSDDALKSLEIQMDQFEEDMAKYS